MPACHKCGRELNTELDFGRQDSCAGCGIPTRTCLNCTHYEPSKYNECTEPVAERVVDKEKSNFCDYFKPTEKKSTGVLNAREQAMKAAEALFKKNK